MEQGTYPPMVIHLDKPDAARRHQAAQRILEHLGRDAGSVDPAHPSRAPPKGDRSR